MFRNLPPLNALRAFEVAGRHGSFSQAAQELSVSHSAISRHVRALEHRLGVQLFRTVSRGVALTPEGQSYLQRIMPALDAISAATEDLAEAPEGQITVNAEPLFASKVLIPLLTEFRRTHPAIDVRVEASQSLADLERYEADFAVRFRRQGVPDLPSDLISDAPLGVFVAPSLAPMGRLSVEEILALPRLKDRGDDVWAMWCGLVGRPADPNPSWRLRANLSYEAALQGWGAYLGSSDCTTQDVLAGRLVQVSPIELHYGGFYLVYGRRGLRSKASRQFRLWLLAQTEGFRRGPGQ